MNSKLKRYVQVAKNFYHLLQALLANLLYGFPSHRLKVIGITGTDGKTTTTHLVYHIFREAGRKASMISTVYAKVGDREYDTGLHTTTPDPFLVQKMLKKAVDNGDEYFVLETTSHALDQNRVWGVRYHIGILTNITHEHLDYHSDYGEYLRTKLMLLERSQVAVINRDDSSFKEAQKLLSRRKTPRIVTYGLAKGADFILDYRKTIPGLADFNAYNYLAAHAVAITEGIGEKEIAASLRTFKLPPGRIDVVYSGKYKVIVDFAHTPNAIDRILKTVRSLHVKNGGRIIHVFGSAGLRDSSKRPLMGSASGKSADLVILTEEDYRTEDPREICRQIEAGLRSTGFGYERDLSADNNEKYTIILDRKTAIGKALGVARRNDVVVITGKGHEKSLCRGTTEHPWDDVAAVKSLIRS